MTFRFHNLLFVCLNDDSTEPAGLGYAAEFARATGATMTLFDAVPPISRVQRHLRFGGPELDESDLAATARRHQLADWASRHRHVTRIGIAIGDGRRTVAASRRVAEAGHDLVVVAPVTDSDDLAVVRRLIRTVPCPLLVVRSPPLTGAVIAALDPDDDLALNAMIAMTSAGIATTARQPLHLVHAFEPHGLRTLRSLDLAEVTEARLASYGERAASAHRRAVDELLDRIRPEAPYVRHVEVGRPAEVIARLAVEHGASIAAVGAAGRRRMPASLIGHTAERVLAATSISLLVVKAPGFVPVDDDEWIRTSAAIAAIGV